MNEAVRRILSLSTKELVETPSRSVLADLNKIADRYSDIGPVPSALLCAKLLNVDYKLHAVHEKTINALSDNVTATVNQLPSTLAVRTFNSFGNACHSDARRILASIQDKFFDNWNPASIAKGSRRPKLKQEMIGIYDEDSTPSKPPQFLAFVRNLSDEDITDCLHAIDRMRERGLPMHEFAVFVSALEKEVFRRTSPESDAHPDTDSSVQ